MEPPNGETAPEPLLTPTQIVDQLAMRAASMTSAPPESEDKGGASPEVEAGDGPDRSAWARRWRAAEAEVELAAEELDGARRDRLALLREMKRTMSLGQIAEVTGLTRQRVGQLLK